MDKNGAKERYNRYSALYRLLEKRMDKGEIPWRREFLAQVQGPKVLEVWGWVLVPTFPITRATWQ
jgi:hypothetical protein